MLLQIQNGTLSIGGQILLSHFHFEIKGNEKIAIVGRNGCGKSSFLRLLAGELYLDREDAPDFTGICTSRKLLIGLLSQQTFSDISLTVEEELLKICPYKDSWERERFLWEMEYDRIFTGFGFQKEDKKKQLSEFSGGEQTKISLIRLLLQKPDILLLDEPNNHLDTKTLEWLEDYLKNYEHAVILVSHDRFFLDQTVDTIWEIENQKLHCYKGNYTSYRQQKQKQFFAQEKAYEQQQEEIKRLEELITRFKNKPKKAAFARSRKKLLERMPKIEKPIKEDAHLFTTEIHPETISAKWVLDAEKLQIGYEKTLLELSVKIRRGQKIGVIGPNGVGKSTFLKTIAGLLPPKKGSYKLGLHVFLGYFDQQTARISSDKSVVEHFHDLFPSLTEKETRSILASFLFSGKTTAKKISQLSGGEKSRLILAELFQARPNFFVLDEPTNHMDIPAKETLESAFRAYTGTMLFVSHDRYFIQQIADALLIFEEDAVFYYPFGYKHYIEHCKKTKGQTLSAQIKAEEQALLSGLQNVPKGERHQLKEISEELAYQDWQMRLITEPLEELRKELEAFVENFEEERAWLEEEYENTYLEQYHLLLERYTKCCLDWYEKWLEFHPEPSQNH